VLLKTPKGERGISLFAGNAVRIAETSVRDHFGVGVSSADDSEWRARSTPRKKTLDERARIATFRRAWISERRGDGPFRGLTRVSHAGELTMAGTLVPLVLLPRYTTLSGPTTFQTIAMDVSDYEEALVDFWRSAGANLGTLGVAFEESTDQVTWSNCAGGPFNDPGANLQSQFKPEMTKRWFRITVTLTGANCVVTMWCIGFLMMRES
jgi:hypothetical protein